MVQDFWFDLRQLLKNMLARYVLAAIVVAFIVVYFVGKASAQDALVIDKGGRIVLEMTKCTSFVAGYFRAGLNPMQATYVIKQAKRAVPGCYVIHADTVYMLFEDGDTLAIPAKEFKPGDASAKKVGFVI